MKIYCTTNKLTYEVDLRKLGGEDSCLCPVCSHTRKKKHDKCLSFNHTTGIGKCWNGECDAKFIIYKELTTIKKEYKRPEKINTTELSDKLVKYFESRGISQFTLRHNKISEGIESVKQKDTGEYASVNTIQFNYFRDGEIVSIKYRDAKKNFKIHKDCELILYGLDDIKDSDTIVIVEGEFDKLAFYESGITNCVSVPNGATVGNVNLTYIDNCIEYFADDRKIIIATDADTAGINLRNELASRLGIERCLKVDFSDCKDANEYLIKYGKTELNNVYNNAVPFPIEGVFTAENVKDELYSLWDSGLQPGMKIGIECLDELVTYEFGRVYIGTGYPGSGKSEVVDEIICRLNLIYGLKAVYFSPENYPMQLHASKLIEKFVGKSFSSQYIDKKTIDIAYEYIKDSFYYIAPENDFTFETILSKARQTILQKGVKILVIDPYNQIEHKKNKSETETEYVSRFMSELTRFARMNNVIIFLIAHPSKPQKLANGSYNPATLYDISGSAHFYSKTDFGFSVFINKESKNVEFYLQKRKFKHLGKEGMCELVWNPINGRYSAFNANLPDYKMHYDYSNYLNFSVNQETGDIEHEITTPINYHETINTFENESKEIDLSPRSVSF